MSERLLHSETTGQIISCFYAVYNGLGSGFNETVYQSALALELRNVGLTCATEVAIDVAWRGHVVGSYRADLIVENSVMVELKVVSELRAVHTAQLLNYLKATRYELGLLLNFGPTPAVERRIFSNERKGSLLWAAPLPPL